MSEPSKLSILLPELEEDLLYIRHIGEGNLVVSFRNTERTRDIFSKPNLPYIFSTNGLFLEYTILRQSDGSVFYFKFPMLVDFRKTTNKKKSRFILTYQCSEWRLEK